MVTNVPLRIGFGLTALVVVGTVAMGWFLDTKTDADLAYWDSLTTVMSFAAMWMTARKYIENWIVWLVVDVVATVMYTVKGLDFYAILYGVYLGMAVWGFLAWRRSLLQALPSV
jgi:nicotinamide mononucleotide transporter